MKKSDLKNGMIFVDRIGRKLMHFEEKLFSIDDNIECGTLIDILENLDDNFSSGLKEDYDIVSISYLGKVLWERKEYITFDEARKSGKLFKHIDWFTRFYNVKGVFDVLSSDCYNYSPSEINVMLDSKEWELED